MRADDAPAAAVAPAAAAAPATAAAAYVIVYQIGARERGGGESTAARRAFELGSVCEDLGVAPLAPPPPALWSVLAAQTATGGDEAVAALLRKHVRACNDKLLELLDVVLVHEGACPELDRLLCFLQHQDETGACPANAAAHSSRVLQSVFDHC